MKKKLPIGIQTFREIREEGYYYVDKTAWAQRLQAEGTHYFLSRPRHFGKSLFLDTLKELFEGSEELFRGLAIHGDRDWSVRYPVVRLGFGGDEYSGAGRLENALMELLDAAEQEASVEPCYNMAPGRFRHLIRTLHERTGQRVVVLVDEYDKPILDALETPEVARANRNFLRGLYSNIKACDAHIKFSFLTGVSKFSKVSLFSGLNNLKDITLDPRYSAICGYTDHDLDRVFAAELSGLDRCGRDDHRGAAVPDRLPDYPGSREAWRQHVLPAGIPEPRGASEYESVPVGGGQHHSGRVQQHITQSGGVRGRSGVILVSYGIDRP